LQNSLLYGSKERGTRAGLQNSPAIAEVFLQDACQPQQLMEVLYTNTECDLTFMNGLLHQSGLRAALTEYMERVRQAMIVREAELQSSSCTVWDFDSGPLNTISELGDFYLPPAFAAASDVWHDEGISSMNAFSQTNVAVTLISVVCLLMFYVAVYKPMIAHLDDEIKSCRSLLLLFPDEVARSVPAVLDASRKMFASTT
jgi:hypothetical protein